MDDRKTRGERREAKRRKGRQMRVVGRGVRLLQEIIKRRAQQLWKRDG